MTITKQIVSLADNITERGQIHVKTITRIVENGDLLTEAVHRKVLNPGDSLVGEAPNVAAVASAVWTPEVLAAWEAGQVPQTPEADWRPLANIEREELCASLLRVLTTLLILYQTKGQTANAAAVVTAMDSLTLIEEDVKPVFDNPASTREQYAAAVIQRWGQIVAPAPPQVKLDFKRYGGNAL